MTEKQVIQKQTAMVCEKCLYSGHYLVTVKHFDGRTISKRRVEDYDIAAQLYRNLCREYHQYATVTLEIVFQIMEV